MISKTDAYKIVMLMFFSLISFTVGIVTSKITLILFGVITGASGFLLRMRDLRCPYCEKPMVLSDILSADPQRHDRVKCTHCGKSVRIEK